MNLLDWLLVVLVLAYALSGYWQGFVTGAFATTGLLLGGLFGVWIAPVALGDANPSLLVSLGALFIVILAASLGQALIQFTGAKIRDKITWQPARAVDAVGGALLSAAAVLLVAWALGVAIAGAGLSGITPLVRESAVLSGVDETLPEQASGVLGGVQQRGRHQLLPALPRAVRARADRRGRARAAAAADRPGRRGRRRERAQDPRHQRVRARRRGLRLRVRRRPGDDQRARRRRGRRPRGRSSTTARCRPRSSTTTPTSTWRCWPPTRPACPSCGSTRPPAPRTASRSWATRRTGRTTCSPAASAPSSACARRTSTARAPSSARCSPCAGWSGPATPAARSSSSTGDVVGVVFAASVTDRDTGYALTADQVQRSAARGADQRRRGLDRRLRQLTRASRGRAWTSSCRAAPSGSPCPGGSPPRARAPASPCVRR